jgi:hypothetical protein
MTMRHALVLTAALVLSGVGVPAFAEQGPNGGQMEDVAGVDAELLVSGNTLTLNVFIDDSCKKTCEPVPTKGYTGAVLIVNGTNRETITLAPSGESSLKGDAKNPIAAGAAITLTLKTAAGKTGQARFKR